MDRDSDIASRNKNPQELLVTKTCRYLIENISEKHMLDTVALSMGTNRSKLAASFKGILGLGVFEYLRKIRMEKAKSLLITSNISIQQISFEVGYENSANFSTAYKKYYQLSPREQRNLYIKLDSLVLINAGSMNDESHYEVELVSVY